MRRFTFSHAFVLAVVILIAAVVRFAGLGQLPAGLYRDEAFYGLDAVNVLRGQHAIYFPANNGREPMFIYLLALSISVLGHSPLAVRLPAAIISLLTVPAAYLMARELFGKRVGLLTAAVLAVTLWPVHLAHVGFRVGLLPLLTVLTIWLAARAWRVTLAHTPRPVLYRGKELTPSHQPAGAGIADWTAAGILYGLCFYTYLAVRFTPLIVAGFFLYAWRAHPKLRPAMIRAAVPFIVSAMLVVLPLAVYALGHWDVFMGRGEQVTIFNPGIGGPNPWLTLAGNTIKALGMFFWRGDFIARHNVPNRPVFDPVMGLVFLVGVLIALVRIFRRESSYTALVFALMWTGVMLVPTILAEDTPHFLRSVGVLPVIAIFPALAIDGLTRLGVNKQEVWFWPILIITLSLKFTASDYFVNYANAQDVRFWFDNAGVQMAAEINRFTGVGWTGNEWIVPDGSPAPDRRVFVDKGLWDGFANTQFLVPQRSALTFIKTGGDLPAPSAGPTLLVLWPYEDWRRDLALLPHQSVIEFREGALSKGDRDKEPIVTYLVIRAEPYTSLPQPLARFKNGVQLVGAQIEGQHIQLTWYTPQVLDADYAVFIHARRGDAIIAQHDGDPANGLYPMTQWRSGDSVVDDHSLSGAWDARRDQVVVGLYRRDTGQRLPVVDAAGKVIGDSAPINP